MANQRFLTVTALTKYIRRKFDVDKHLNGVWLKGELSNFKQHSRGHMYFTVKDENARIQGVMFAGDNSSLPFTPEEGMKVLLRGDVTVYEPYGQYQMYVKEMQPDGIGSLYLAFEELKKKLDQEGLFDLENKKDIPRFPEHIGVITSPTGAAVRDIFITIKRRFPIAKITLIPALVQGDRAAASIVNAIKQANQMKELNVLILGRGGGSIEDLWPFNEEVVAREIFKSTLPIISAVGHETDFTIADFVSDLRAPTPTGAAELAVPSITDIKERLSQRQVRLARVFKEKQLFEKERLFRLKNSYAFRYPKQLYQQKEQDLDRNLDQLERIMKQIMDRKRDQYKYINKRVRKSHPYEKFLRAHDKLNTTTRNLEKGASSILKEKQMNLGQAISKLNAMNPLKVMERGFGVVYDQQENLVKSIKQIEAGESISVQLSDGKVDCQVESIEEREYEK